MATAITAPNSVKVSQLVDRFLSEAEMVAGELALAQLPSSTERAALERRATDLHRELQPISLSTAAKARAQSAIAEMLGGYTSLLKANAEELTATFVALLRELPLFAIITVCERVRTGKVPECLVFPPAEPLLYAMASEIQAPVREEKERIAKVLSTSRTRPPQLTGERRRELGKQLSLLSRAIQTPSGEEERLASVQKRVAAETIDRTNQSILAEYKKLGIDPVYGPFGIIAPSTLRTIGRLPAPG